MDLTHGELQTLADYHTRESDIYASCLRAAGKNRHRKNHHLGPPADQIDSYHRMAEHHRERGRQMKELLAREEHDQTVYEEIGTVIIRRPDWLDECIMVLNGYKDNEEMDGVTKLSCGVVTDLLEYHYSEEDDDEDKGDDSHPG